MCPRSPRRSSASARTPTGPERARSRLTTQYCSPRSSLRGALASFEATRYAAGHKNGLRIELNGSAAASHSTWSASTSWSSSTGRPARPAGFRRILVTEPDHPYLAAWWPPGHTLGWEHTFTHQARDLLTAIAEGGQPLPSFADGLAVQRVLDAVARSAAANRWESAAPADVTSIHPLHRPVGRPAVRGSVPAGQLVGLRRPRDRVLGRPLRGRPCAARGRLPCRAARAAGQVRAEVLGDLLPPRWAGGLRPPDRRAAPGHPARPDLGRRGARGRPPAGGGRGQGHGAGGGRVRRGDRHRLHRLVDLAHGRDVPARAGVDDRARLRRTSRTAGTPSSTSSTPRGCGSRTRCTRARSRTTSGPRSGRWRQ